MSDTLAIVIFSDDVIEIADPIGPTTTTTRRTGCALSRDDNPSPEAADEAHYEQPMAVRCEDGGYMLDPRTISNSPIRTYTPLNALAPKERDAFQNQFQTTGRSRNYRNVFDELVGACVAVAFRQFWSLINETCILFRGGEWC